MPLNSGFWKAVEGLQQPAMGTELMGPLLYSLARSTRPRNVMEAGMGYTSPFLAQALADNLDDFNSETLQLEAKLRSWWGRKQKLVAEHREAEMGRVHEECLLGEPALASPSYYCSEYQPILHLVDNMTNTESSAPKALGVLQELGLQGVLQCHNLDLKRFVEEVDSDWLPFDLIWIDSDGGVSFDGDGGAFVRFEDLFRLLNPDGGLMVLHDTMTSARGGEIIAALREAQAKGGFKDFELLNLLEPHKLLQSSATLIRKTSGYQPSIFHYSIDADLQEEMRRFLEMRARFRTESARRDNP